MLTLLSAGFIMKVSLYTRGIKDKECSIARSTGTKLPQKCTAAINTVIYLSPASASSPYHSARPAQIVRDMA